MIQSIQSLAEEESKVAKSKGLAPAPTRYNMIRSFEASDKFLLYKLYESHGLTYIPDSIDGAIGLIYDEIAVAFIYRLANTKVGFIEGLITDKKAPLFARNEAINTLVSALEERALELGIENLFVLTEQPSVGVRAATLGYKNYDQYQLFVKELK